MQFNVPQYVELEDKLAFRLTAKQLLWFGVGGVILFALWSVFEKWVFWLYFPFVMVLSVAFAFWRPAGLSAITFLVLGIKHFFRPKKLTWSKETVEESKEEKYGKRKIDRSKEELVRVLRKKEKAIENSDALAKILDEKSDL